VPCFSRKRVEANSYDLTQLIPALNTTFPRYGVVRLTVPRSGDCQAENDGIRNVEFQVKIKPHAL
ncbi:hypothetical protein ACE1ET_20545, partial [Saccharicrinis sp. FJH62]|uniref:hypothetical protein n=1 Tax=Saccharicrinis sp. FJH62 TaxID=3344657 RepID=UPI0035D4215B